MPDLVLIRAAHLQAGATLQGHEKLTVDMRNQLDDSIQVNQGRPVDSLKDGQIKQFLEILSFMKLLKEIRKTTLIKR